MVVLVTGGTSYLGCRLVEQLVAQGETVRVFLRPGSAAPKFPSGVQIAIGDLLIPEDPVAAMEGVTRVYHLATLIRQIQAKKQRRTHNIHVDSTRHLLQAARVTGVKRVVHSASCVGLGPTGESIVDENVLHRLDSPDNSKRHISPYEDSVRAADKVARDFEGLEVVRVYPCFIYGPGMLDRTQDKESALTPLIVRIHDMAHSDSPWILAPGNRHRTTAFIDDVVNGHLLAMEKGTPSHGYILGGEDIHYAGLASLISEIMDRNVRPKFAPVWMQKLIANGSALRSRLSGSKIPGLTPGLVERENHNWRYSSQKAISELGYARTPIKEGLRRTLEWLGKLPPDPKRVIS